MLTFIKRFFRIGVSSSYERRLIGACFGDSRKAEGCIAYELKRLPNLSRPQAVIAALDRLEHDRR